MFCTLKGAVLTLAVLLLAACGGSGSSGGGAPTPPTQVNPGITSRPLVRPDPMLPIPATIHPALDDAYGDCMDPIKKRSVRGMARFVSAAGINTAASGARLRVVDTGYHGQDMLRVAAACLGAGAIYHEVGADGNPGSQSIDQSEVKKGMDAALKASDTAGGTWVINASLTDVLGDAPSGADGVALKSGENCRVLLIVAAGNDERRSNPAQNYADRTALDCGIIVTSTLSGIGASPCGDAMQDCLTGLTRFPTESVDQRSCGIMGACRIGGTSAASIATASMLAAIVGHWPALTPETLKALALRCADADRLPGQTGVERRYGRGALSMVCLFNPQGQLVAPTTGMVITGTAAIAGLASVTGITGLDDYKRDFTIPVAQPLNFIPGERPEGQLLTDNPLLRAYADTGRLGVALTLPGIRLDTTYIRSFSPLSPVRGTGSWAPGPVLTLAASTSTSLTRPGWTMMLAGQCGVEHMLPKDSSLLRAYDAFSCAAFARAGFALRDGWTLQAEGVAATPRAGRVRLAGHTVTLGGPWQGRVRLALTARW